MPTPTIDTLNLFCDLLILRAIVVSTFLHVVLIAVLTDLNSNKKEIVSIKNRPLTINSDFDLVLFDLLTMYVPQSRQRNVVHWLIGVR